MDIEKLLGQIESLREFLAEPAPATPTSDSLLKRYLAERYGPVWLMATITSYVLPAQTIHVCIVAFRRGVSVRVVSETSDGELVEGQGIDPYPEKEGRSAQEEAESANPEQDCLDLIIPALIEARAIIKSAKIEKARRKHLRDQLVHAVTHLMEKGN